MKITFKDFCKPYTGNGVVYAICTLNKVVYIGSTTNLLRRLICHNSTKDKNSIRSKSGRKIQTFGVVVICETTNLINLLELEQRCLDTFIKEYGELPKYNLMNSYVKNKPYKYTSYLG